MKGKRGSIVVYCHIPKHSFYICFSLNKVSPHQCLCQIPLVLQECCKHIQSKNVILIQFTVPPYSCNSRSKSSSICTLSKLGGDYISPVSTGQMYIVMLVILLLTGCFYNLQYIYCTKAYIVQIKHARSIRTLLILV